MLAKPTPSTSSYLHRDIKPEKISPGHRPEGATPNICLFCNKRSPLLPETFVLTFQSNSQSMFIISGARGIQANQTIGTINNCSLSSSDDRGPNTTTSLTGLLQSITGYFLARRSKSHIGLRYYAMMSSVGSQVLK